MHACMKKWTSPCHKRNPNVIPNLIQYVYVIPLWNAPKLKLSMTWSWHKNSNKFSNIESYLHFQFMIWIHASMEMYNFNMHINVITTTLNILLLSNFVVSKVWQNFLSYIRKIDWIYTTKTCFSTFFQFFLSNLKKHCMTLINNIINDNPIHHQIEPFHFCTQLHRLSYHNIASTHM
jgi:hypothetical protein